MEYHAWKSIFALLTTAVAAKYALLPGLRQRRALVEQAGHYFQVYASLIITVARHQSTVIITARTLSQREQSALAILVTIWGMMVGPALTLTSALSTTVDASKSVR